MKIALVHELLTMRGGAERVTRVLAEMFPDAPVYTLLYNEKKLGGWFPKDRVRTSGLQPATCNLLPDTVKFNHHLYLSRFPKAIEQFDFRAFDLVISVSSAFAHGIITNGSPKHIAFINAPARYLWDRTHDVLERAGRGFLGSVRRVYLERVFHRLRIWDAEAADRADMLLAASKDVQRRIELHWRRPSTVVYPPVDDYWLEKTGTGPVSNASNRKKNRTCPGFFAIVSTLAPYKRIDLAIEACNALKLPLKIAGEGEDRRRLERLAGPTVTFLGYRERGALHELLADASAFLFPGEEDYGIAPLEAMACGTPVIAYRGGGALETIAEGETGAFFGEPTVESLQRILESFNPTSFSPDACRRRAGQFSRAQFEAGIRSAIETTMAGSREQKTGGSQCTTI